MYKETLTATGSVEFDNSTQNLKTGGQFVGGCQGNAQDYTWEVQYSLGGGWSAHKDAAGNSLFTGDDVKALTLLTDKIRIEIKSLGTATSIIVQGGNA